MPPRLLDADRCPHCKQPLTKPQPRACPSCGGSLQKRYLTAGCLSSAPKLLVLGFAAWELIERVRGA